MNTEQTADKWLPLSETVSWVLIVLFDGVEKYAWQIRQEIVRRSDGVVDPALSNLYPMLNRLIGDGIVGFYQCTVAVNRRGAGKVGTFYYLTSFGESIPYAEIARLRERIDAYDSITYGGVHDDGQPDGLRKIRPCT